MLDCEVVKYDGSVFWASQEPELLWAIRGGSGGFGGKNGPIFLKKKKEKKRKKKVLKCALQR
jgi:hypothetical protein